MIKRITAGLLGLGIIVIGLVGLAAPASAAPAAPAAVRPLAGTVIGVEYSDANYQGATYTITGGTCTGTTSDVDWQLSPLASGWNDVISSFHSYANCWTKLWENTGYWGASYGYVGDTTYVGNAMNDRASSIQWS
jgi:hypothetical protein